MGIDRSWDIGYTSVQFAPESEQSTEYDGTTTEYRVRIPYCGNESEIRS